MQEANSAIQRYNDQDEITLIPVFYRVGTDDPLYSTLKELVLQRQLDDDEENLNGLKVRIMVNILDHLGVRYDRDRIRSTFVRNSIIRSKVLVLGGILLLLAFVAAGGAIAYIAVIDGTNEKRSPLSDQRRAAPTAAPVKLPVVAPSESPSKVPIKDAAAGAPSIETITPVAPPSSPVTVPSIITTLSTAPATPVTAPSNVPITAAATVPTPVIAPPTSPITAQDIAPITTLSTAPAAPVPDPVATTATAATTDPTLTPVTAPVAAPPKSPFTDPTPSTTSPNVIDTVRLINAKTLTGQSLRYPLPTSDATIEERALAWIVDDDELQLMSSSTVGTSTLEACVVQRYAVATLWFTANGPRMRLGRRQVHDAFTRGGGIHWLFATIFLAGATISRNWPVDQYPRPALERIRIAWDDSHPTRFVDETHGVALGPQ